VPKELEQKLEREYRKKGLKGKRLQHAVYGTMTNILKKQHAAPRGKRKS